MCIQGPACAVLDIGRRHQDDHYYLQCQSAAARHLWCVRVFLLSISMPHACLPYRHFSTSARAGEDKPAHAPGDKGSIQTDTWRQPERLDSNYALRGCHRKCAFGAIRPLEAAPNVASKLARDSLCVRPRIARSSARILIVRGLRLRRPVPGAGASAGSRVGVSR